MRRLWIFIVTSILTCGALSAQEIRTTPDGRQLITFTPGQETAIDQFIRSHPGMLQVNCTTLGLTDTVCANSAKEWRQTVADNNGHAQYQYAAWGSYRHHASPDLIVPFFSKRSVNNWGWRGWQIVAFEAIGPDRYLPLVTLKSSWGACFDGMLYHPVRKRVEFWCNSMGGSISWNGKTFVGEIAKGD
jgi:hypothetical protein